MITDRESGGAYNFKWVEKIALKSLATGNFGWFVVLCVSLALIYKLPPADIKLVLLEVLRGLGWLGWLVGVGSVYGSVKVIRWREKVHQAEIERNVAFKNQLIQMGFQLPLETTKSKNERRA